MCTYAPSGSSRDVHSVLCTAGLKANDHLVHHAAALPAHTAHLKAAKLLPIHNFWSYIYDFTPKPGNWKLLGPEATVESLLGPKIPDDALAALGKHGKEVRVTQKECTCVSLPGRRLGAEG